MHVKGRFESAEFLKYLIKGMAEGVIFIDKNNIIRICNPVGGLIRGVKGEDIVGKNFLYCHPEETHEKVLSLIEELKKSGDEVKRTVRFKGGFYEHSYSAVQNSDERFLGIVAVSRDITERELMGRDLKDHAKKLEQSNKIKDLFADIMGHDLLNPSGVISNYADLLLDEELSQEVESGIISIKKSAERLIEMIENTSTYSKLEDVEDLTFEETNMTQVVKEVIKDFQPLIDDKNMRITYESSGKYLAELNPIIKDVFSNLLSNAIKYSPEGSNIKIWITDEGEKLKFSIADRAETIPQEYRSSIFERFHRLGKESVKGSGLGLAIVKRIMDIHAGSVAVDENPQGGNIFHMVIPKRQIRSR